MSKADVENYLRSSTLTYGWDEKDRNYGVVIRPKMSWFTLVEKSYQIVVQFDLREKVSDISVREVLTGP